MGDALNITLSKKRLIVTDVGGESVAIEQKTPVYLCSNEKAIALCVERPNTRICSDGKIYVIVNQGISGANGIGTLPELLTMLRSLPEYESDEAATAAGKDVYLASNSDYVNGAHNGAYPGTLIVLK